MLRRAVVLLALAALGGAAASGPSAASKGAEPGPTRVQVVAREFYFQLSRYTVTAGPSVVELVNFGQDAHDLRLERKGGSRVYGTPQVQPGGHYDIAVRLLPGTYELWCSVANHRKLGMEAVLKVKPRARG